MFPASTDTRLSLIFSAQQGTQKVSEVKPSLGKQPSRFLSTVTDWSSWVFPYQLILSADLMSALIKAPCLAVWKRDQCFTKKHHENDEALMREMIDCMVIYGHCLHILTCLQF